MNESGIQIRIGDLLYAVAKRWKMILSITLGGLILGICLVAMSYLRGSNVSYRIQSSVAVIPTTEDGLYSEGSYYYKNSDFTLGEDMVSSVIYVLSSDRLVGEVISDLALTGVTVKDIQNNLSFEQYNDTQIIEITFDWKSEKEGKSIVNQIIKEANTLLPKTLSVGSVAVINEPSSSHIFGGSVNAVTYLMLAVVGFIAGVAIAVMDLLTRPTLLNLKDVEPVLELETIGTIPEDVKYFRRKRSLLSSDGMISVVEENYASAAYILRNRIGTRKTHQCMYVTSTMSGEGKTSAAANLAVQLAEMEHKVLLLDLDMRNPNLGGLFLERVDYSRSLNALYRGEIDTEGAITHLTGYLDLLPTVLEHNPIPLDGSLFDLINSLKPMYDYIIMDAPSVGEVSDALSLNQVADSVIFVIKYDTAVIDSIRSAITKLDKSGIRILGCIVNGTKTDAQAIKDARNASKRVRRAKPAPTRNTGTARKDMETSGENGSQQTGGTQTREDLRKTAPSSLMESVLESGDTSAPDWDTDESVNEGVESSPSEEIPENPLTKTEETKETEEKGKTAGSESQAADSKPDPLNDGWDVLDDDDSDTDSGRWDDL